MTVATRKRQAQGLKVFADNGCISERSAATIRCMLWLSELLEEIIMDCHIPIINDFGGSPVAEHDVICPVCRKHHAVLLLNTGQFFPCWNCQRDGWRTYQLPRWIVKILDSFYR